MSSEIAYVVGAAGVVLREETNYFGAWSVPQQAFDQYNRENAVVLPRNAEKFTVLGAGSVFAATQNELRFPLAQIGLE